MDGKCKKCVGEREFLKIMKLTQVFKFSETTYKFNYKKEKKDKKRNQVPGCYGTPSL